MADIKKILMQKKIGATVYGIHPETEASIVEYTLPAANGGTKSTVAAQLDDILAKLGGGEGSVSKQIEDAVTAAKQEIFGITEDKKLVEAYDTLVEIGNWIAADESRTIDLVDKVGKNTAAISTIRGELDNTTTGIHKKLADLAAEDTRLDGAITAAKEAAISAAAGDATDKDNALKTEITNAYKAAIKVATDAHANDKADLEQSITSARTDAANAVSDLRSDMEAADTGLDNRINTLETAKTQVLFHDKATAFDPATVNANDLYFVELGAPAPTA